MKWIAGFSAAFFAVADMYAADIVQLVDWEFTRNGTAWQKVEVPDDWAIVGPFDREIDRQVVAIEQNGEKVATEKTGRSLSGTVPRLAVSGPYEILRSS